MFKNAWKKSLTDQRAKFGKASLYMIDFLVRY